MDGAVYADPYDLQRFVTAQDADGTFDRAVAELVAGRKTSHWMWFVFPQLAGLGRSSTARRYAITSTDEARAYLAHPVLGPRLRRCHRLAATAAVRDAEQLLGAVDALKLHSSATLFAGVDDAPEFVGVLERYFGGRPDPETVRLTS